MDQQRQSYGADAASQQHGRYSQPPNGPQQQQQMQQPLGTGHGYEAYQAPSIPSQPSSMAVSPIGTPRMRTYSQDSRQDIAMEDADPYNKLKYPSRPHHQQRPSGQYLAQDSSTGRRYSPVKALSPSSPYTPGSTQGMQTPYTPLGYENSSARQSPTRSSQYTTPSQSNYGTPRQPPLTLPPIQPGMNPSPDHHYPQSATAQLNAVFGREARSPRVPRTPQHGRTDRGPVPSFRKLDSIQDLQPRINPQPAFRRADPEGGFISPLQALTTHLPSTYRICNPAFQYESSRNPRRVLTKPSKGTKNDGFDNEDSDYILFVNDILGNEDNGHKNRYLILDVLGQGTFGQVVKCQNLKTQEVVAVKVVKNRTAYFNQSMMEVSVLDLLNGKLDKHDDHHLLRLKDTFIHRQHLCLVFELLSVNLYELIKQNQFRGLSTTLVRVFAQQLLNGLNLLNKARLIHCDLKPENILLKKYVFVFPFL